jgi:cytochrome d ubiquinol oxidase subunit I
MMVSAGTSPSVSATDVTISLVGILLLYSLLFFLWIYGLTREIRRGPELAPGAVASRPAAAVPPAEGAPPAADSVAPDAGKAGR